MFTLGVDFGTNSVRALIVRCSDGAEFGSRVIDYPSGAQGVLLEPKDGLLARQNPGDYLFGLEKSVAGALAEASRKPGFDASKVVGIGLDSTGSSNSVIINGAVSSGSGPIGRRIGIKETQHSWPALGR